MHYLRRSSLAACVCLVAFAVIASNVTLLPNAEAQPSDDDSSVANRAVADVPARQCHPWGRFPAGTWKKVRVRSEMVDDNGKVVSSSLRETETTLTEVNDDHVVLKFEMSVEVAGKRFDQQPQFVKQGYFGSINGEKVTIKESRKAKVEVDGRELECYVVEAVVQEGERTRVTELTMCDSESPYLLKRNTTAKTAEGKDVYSTDVETVALGMPYKVLTEMKTAAFMKTTHRDSEGVTQTYEIFCGDVPGGIIAHSSKEVNADGNVVRRTALELVDYALPPSNAP